MKRLLDKVLWSLLLIFDFATTLLVLCLCSPLLIGFWVYSKVILCLIRCTGRTNYEKATGLDSSQGFPANGTDPYLYAMGRYENKIIFEDGKRVAANVLNIQDENGRYKYRRLKQIFEKVLGYFIFRDVDIDIDNHVEMLNVHRFICHKYGCICGKSAGSDDEFEYCGPQWEVMVHRVMEHFSAERFSKDVPQWKFLLIYEPNQ